ncbi:MAG: TIGR02597 family protein [Roseimicrobium sp.]
MKKLQFTLALIVASASLLSAQVVTKAVGFTTLNLQAGNNFVGLSLQPSSAFQGAITISPTDRSHVFLTGAVVANDQFNPATISSATTVTHVIEITAAGATQGTNTLIIDTISSGAELVLQDALPASVADGSSITIWKLWTIGDAFGATNQAGLTPGTASTADLILLPNGAGYSQYFYSSGGFTGTGWRKVGSGTANQSAVPLYYTDGVIIAAKSAKSVTVTGEIKSGKTNIVLETGNNLVVNLCPVNAGGATPSTEGRTLGNTSLYTGNASTGLTGATTATAADQVLIWNGTGYNQYYYSTGGFSGIGWRQVGGGATDKAAVALPDGCYVILRRGAPVSIQLAQGNF